jgi:uncharacterized damage-inducible protein DinB
MYRKIEDFLFDWRNESDITLSMFRNITNETMSQRINQEGRTLGFLCWHISVTPEEMLGRAGLVIEGPVPHAPAPATIGEIISAYETTSNSTLEVVGTKWKDEFLTEEVEMYGDMWTKGQVLSVLIRHQTHHRGQMTVLMRQAGLVVPGAYGPAREEWAAWGMPAVE